MAALEGRGVLAEELWRTINSCTQSESYLHSSNWEKHVEKRPEIQDHLQSVRQTVEDPDFVLQNNVGVLFKYRRGFPTNVAARPWLVVIEQAGSDGAYFVKTMYFTNTIYAHATLCLTRIR